MELKSVCTLRCAIVWHILKAWIKTFELTISSLVYFRASIRKALIFDFLSQSERSKEAPIRRYDLTDVIRYVAMVTIHSKLYPEGRHLRFSDLIDIPRKTRPSSYIEGYAQSYWNLYTIHLTRLHLGLSLYTFAD